jgi:hypothetical protein
MIAWRGWPGRAEAASGTGRRDLQHDRATTKARVCRGTLAGHMTALPSFIEMSRADLLRCVNDLRSEHGTLLGSIRHWREEIAMTEPRDVERGVAIRKIVEAMSQWKAQRTVLEAAEVALRQRSIEPPRSEWDEPTEPNWAPVVLDHDLKPPFLPMLSARRLAERLR